MTPLSVRFEHQANPQAIDTVQTPHDDNLHRLKQIALQESGLTEMQFMQLQSQPYARVRHAFVYVARQKLGVSYLRIGRTLMRDHTTVMKGCDRASALLTRSPKFKTLVDAMSTKLEELRSGKMVTV
jgi:hypothetical protein